MCTNDIESQDLQRTLFTRTGLCVVQLVEGAEAKALYGLTLNYKPLEALVDRLLRDTTLSGDQVAEVLDGAGLIPFPDPFVEGFKWDDTGRLVYPGMPEEVSSASVISECRDP